MEQEVSQQMYGEGVGEMFIEWIGDYVIGRFRDGLAMIYMVHYNTRMHQQLAPHEHNSYVLGSITAQVTQDD